jgi:hypothetical protein
MTFAAIEHLFLETEEGAGEGFDLLIGLAEEMQDEAQGCSASHSRKRCHLVDGLL